MYLSQCLLFDPVNLFPMCLEKKCQKYDPKWLDPWLHECEQVHFKIKTPWLDTSLSYRSAYFVFNFTYEYVIHCIDTVQVHSRHLSSVFKGFTKSVGVSNQAPHVLGKEVYQGQGSFLV